MAKEMLRLARRAAPLIFAGAGPGCLKGACPEGPMSCGAMAEVRKEFQQL
jgi:thymidylate synthase (FAD)